MVLFRFIKTQAARPYILLMEVFGFNCLLILKTYPYVKFLAFHKMLFIFNCVEKGWNVKKRDGRYIFQKSHDGKREVFMEDYLEKFIAENSSL